VKIRAFAAAAVLLLAALAALLGWEFSWRAQHDLLKPSSPAPDGAYVAEVRALPARPGRPEGASGVFVRGRWEYLRAFAPKLVFVGACDEVSARWFTERRLVIECDLRAGEPRLVREFVEGVAIELVVNRRFAFLVSGEDV
jgi:hypothetical protein